jgi:poly(A) polymerase
MNEFVKNQNNIGSYGDLAEELIAAIEASTGKEQEVLWTNPMGEGEMAEAIDRLLLSPRPDRGLDILVRTGTMEAVLPELYAIVGFGEGIRHKDVWMHTKTVVLRTPARSAVRWGALFHDIGKVHTRKFAPNGQVTFIGHPEVGARMFSRIARQLKLSSKMSDRVSLLIASHLRAAAYDETWTDSAVRRFTKDMGEILDDLLDLSKADITSKYEEKVRRGTRQIDLLAERIEEIRRLDAKPRPLPTGLGHALMAHFEIAPGPGLGKLISRLTSEVEAGRLEVQGEYLHYIRFIEHNSALLEDAVDGEVRRPQ